MLTTRLGLIGSLLLFAGCPHRIVLPDQGRVHQLAAPVDLTVWCKGPEAATWTKCDVRADKGWWLAPPSIAEGLEGP
jgi:hypothetical protein